MDFEITQNELDERVLKLLDECVLQVEKTMRRWGDAAFGQFFWVMHQGYWNMFQATLGPFDDDQEGFLGFKVHPVTSKTEPPQLIKVVGPDIKPNFAVDIYGRPITGGF